MFYLIYAICFIISLLFIIQEIKEDNRYKSTPALSLNMFLGYLFLLAIAPVTALCYIIDWFQKNGNRINILNFNKKEE